MTEHVYLLYRVPGTSRTVHHPFHPGVGAPVQYGPRFGALLVYLSDYQLIPQARISKLCFDLYGRAISADTINRFRGPCFEHLEAFEEQLKKDLAESPVLHADQTGIRICGKCSKRSPAPSEPGKEPSASPEYVPISPPLRNADTQFIKLSSSSPRQTLVRQLKRRDLAKSLKQRPE